MESCNDFQHEAHSETVTCNTGIILISGYSHIFLKKDFERLSPEQLRKGEWGQLSGVQPLRGTTVRNLIVKRTNANMCDLFYCVTCEKCKAAIA